jgi:two-component system cell cycle response regulator CtrA
MKILLALGSDNTVGQIQLALEHRGWAVLDDARGWDAEQYVAGGSFDAVVIDPALPEAARTIGRLRKAAPDLAIIALGTAPGISLLARLLDAGADDVLTRPVSPEEISLRARAIARRRNGHSDAAIRFGHLVVVPGQQATFQGRRLPLTSSQFAILEFLALRAGRSVTREAILGALYGGMDEPNAKIIDVFMTKLRGVLRTHGAPINIIGTIWGRGYIMPAPYAVDAEMPSHGADVMRHMPRGHDSRRYAPSAFRGSSEQAA